MKKGKRKDYAERKKRSERGKKKVRRKEVEKKEIRNKGYGVRGSEKGVEMKKIEKRERGDIR